MKRWTVYLLPAFCLSVWFGCNTRASDAGDFAEKSIENQCYIIKKCQKYNWNDAEWKNIKDCVEDCASSSGDCDLEELIDMADEFCPDYDEDKANECLSQMISVYNSCTPAHDYDDADFDCEDDPCLNICGECQGGSWGYSPLSPWNSEDEVY
jgi:hypothetical protein